MHLNTHLAIDTSLCGKVTLLEENYAEVCFILRKR